MITGEGHFIKPTDAAHSTCSVNGCSKPGHWCEYSRFDAPHGRSIAFYPVCKTHMILRAFKVTFDKRAGTFAAANPGDARDAALHTWFGPDVFWDMDGSIGRVVHQRPVTRHGKPRLLEKPLTKFGKLTIKEVRA